MIEGFVSIIIELGDFFFSLTDFSLTVEYINISVRSGASEFGI